MRDFGCEKRTVTTIRHTMTLPVNWMDMQRLIRVAVEDLGHGPRTSDDELWIEADDETIAVCYAQTNVASS